MSQEDGGDGVDDEGSDGDGLAGMSVDEAAAVVVDSGDADDPEAARETLTVVAEEGVVSEAARDDALAHVSKVVSTPETRVELASMALAGAEERAAEAAADLDVVRRRLDAYEAELEALDTRVSDLADDLQALVGRANESGGYYAVACEVRRLTEEANALQRAADDLQFDLESFERWVTTPAARYVEVEEDLDALVTALDELASAADGVADAMAESDRSATDSPADTGATWFDATLHHGVLGLTIEDLRAELADLRTWDAREGRDDETRADDVADRLDRLEERWTSVGDRLDDRSRTEWRERYGDRIDAFEARLDDVEPPVDWAALQAELDRHRSEIERAE